MTDTTVDQRANSLAIVAHVADRLAWYAFAILIVTSPMSARLNLWARPVDLVAPSYTDFNLPGTYVGMIGILGLWIVSLACRRRPVDVGPRFIWIPVVGLLIVSAAGVPGSIDPALAAFNVARLLVVVGLGAYVVNEIDGFERLAVPIMLMIGLEAVIGISQVVLQRSLGLSWLAEPRLAVGASNSSVVGAADGSRWLRAYGLTSHPNILGGIVAFAMLLLAGTQSVTRPARLVRLAVLGFGAVLLFLTFTRGAWLGFGAGLLVALVMLAVRGDRTGLRQWASAAAITAVVGAVLAVPFAAQLGARATITGPVATESRSIDERIALMHSTLPVVTDHALLGTGLGLLPLVIAEREPDYAFAYQPVHFVPLLAAAETGLIGLLCYLVLAVAPWLALIRIRVWWTRSLAWTSAALAAVTVVGMFDFYTWGPTAGRTWAWIVLGLWVVAYRGAVGRRVPDTSATDTSATGAAATLAPR